MWKWIRRGVAAIVAVVVASGAVVAYQLFPKVPERPFVKPDGEWNVATTEWEWIDSSRAEPYTRDTTDRRRVIVQLWYPTRATSGDTALVIRDRRAFASTLGGWAGRKAKSNSPSGSPVAQDAPPFPVLVYNHGAGWTRWSATYSTEWMASHGYVVVSVEHFGLNQTTRYLDGTPFVQDSLAFPEETGDDAADDQAMENYLARTVLPIWSSDARFVIDRLSWLNGEAGEWRGRLDLAHIGAYGWSMGGALALQLAREDSRVIAAANHDGQLFPPVRDSGTRGRVLQLRHGIDDAKSAPAARQGAMRALARRVAIWDSTAQARSSGDWYSFTIPGTDHGAFSDLVLYNTQPPGRTTPRIGHAIANAYTLAFFDRYLRGRESSRLGPPASPAEGPRLVSLDAWR